jgi:hypothetical protein
VECFGFLDSAVAEFIEGGVVHTIIANPISSVNIFTTYEERMKEGDFTLFGKGGVFFEFAFDL